MIIAKDRAIGNCRLCNLNGHHKFTLCIIRTVCPWFEPLKIVASMTFSPSLVIWSLVPLHRPSCWSRLRSNIIGAPTFRTRRCGRSPEEVVEQFFLVNTVWWLLFSIDMFYQCPYRHKQRKILVDYFQLLEG